MCHKKELEQCMQRGNRGLESRGDQRVVERMYNLI